MKLIAGLTLAVTACGGGGHETPPARSTPDAGADVALACATDAFALTDVDVGEVRLHVGCRNPSVADPPTAVLLHGYPEFYATWNDVAAPLAAAGFRVIAPDLRGYDLSDRPPQVEAYRLERLVDDVVGLISHVSSARVLLIAHDWGGVVAWSLAHEHPELLRGLVVMNGPHPDVWERPEVDPVQARAGEAYIPLLAGLTVGPEVVESQIQPFLTAAELEAYRAVWSIPGAKEAMANWYGANVYPKNTMRTGNDTSVPTLVIWGMKDPFCTPSELDHLPPLVSNLTVVNLPEVGHWVPLEAPDTVAKAIVDFDGRL